jgi:hypothetical protein
MNDADVLLMLDRVRTAVLESAGRTDDLLVALTEKMAAPVPAPVLPAPEPVVVREPLPAPEIVIPDFSAVLRQVLSEIAESSERTERSLDALVDHLEMLTEKVTQSKPVMAVGSGRGDAALSDVDRGLLTDIKRAVSDFSTKYDYDVRTDSNPVYIGKALTDTSTAASTWVLIKFGYDGSDRPVDIEIRNGSWDDRASAGWSF